MDLDAPTLVLGGGGLDTEVEQDPPSPKLEEAVQTSEAAIGDDDPLLELLNDDCGATVVSRTAASSSASSSSTPAPSAVVANIEGEKLAKALPVSTFTRAATQTLDLHMDDALDLPDDKGGVAITPTSLPFAHLVSTNASTALDVPLDVDSVTVGRDEACAAVLQDLRVSGEQFRVRRSVGSAGNWEYDLEDISRNGTIVSKKIVKGSVVKLRENDLIEVLPAAKVGHAQAIAFLFQGSRSDPPISSPFRANDSASQGEPLAKKARTTAEVSSTAASTEDLFEFAICVICQEVIHRSTSIQPCGHSFCSACLGTWLKKPSKWGRTCPVCRTEVASVSRQHQMDGLIQGLLKAHPSKGRGEKELSDLDAQDPLMAAGYDLSRLADHSTPSSSSGVGVAVGAAVFAADGMEHESDEDDSDDEDAYSEGSSAPAPAPALAPFRRPLGPPCFHCGGASWRTLGEAADNVAGSSAPGRARTEFVKQALSGNDFERGILEEWLTGQGQSFGAKLLEILETPNPIDVAPVRVYLPDASAAIFGMPVDSAPSSSASATAMPEGSWTGIHGCRGCCMGVLRALTYSLRERIPEGQLPAAARGRRNCWYGRGCRTQSHKPEHGVRLNHICEQTRF